MALGVGIGYLLGRSHKMRLALMVAAAGAAGKLGGSPGALLQRGLSASPELAKMTDAIRGELIGAVKAAAVTATSNRIDSLSDRIKHPGKARDKEAEPQEDEEDDVRQDNATDQEPDEDTEDTEEPEAPVSRARRSRTGRGGSRQADEESGEDTDEDAADEPERPVRRTRRSATSRSASRSTDEEPDEEADEEPDEDSGEPEQPAKRARRSAASRTTSRRTKDSGSEDAGSDDSKKTPGRRAARSTSGTGRTPARRTRR
ncbi:hypothetical protein [Lentzea nigeriaca]|uniref:hypothetical protein n=1 Tax=Lentzea nigeriaca TaxID=1128665 RepID=UPI001959F561|nr:hypothetical protein [Lentzea nigeriaca]MBM7864301.1 hypothetical protein [Lentzea nigeriaca]